jgi:hypothetical protein
LIVLAAVAITGYQRQARLRPPRPPASAPKLPPFPPPPDAADGAAVKAIAVRTIKRAPDPALLPGVEPPPDSIPEPPARQTVAVGGRSPDVRRLEPPAPRTSPVAEPLSPDSPELAFRTVTHPAAADEPQPKVTRDAILAEIQAEAAQKKAQQDQLGREVAEAKIHDFVEALHRTNSGRRPFHDELRRALRERGDDAGPEIKSICDRYGRETHTIVEKKYKVDMSRWNPRMTRAAKVEKLRAAGLPEPRIFDFLASELDKLIGQRGGPANPNEVRVRAAQRLLMYPPPPVADASYPPAPGATTAVRAPGAP